MGTGFSNMVHVFRGREPIRILMVGLNGAGKTTILYHFKLDEVIAATPTMGFNMELIAHRDVRFAVWDIAGDPHLRFLWSKYLKDTVGVIYVVDAADNERLLESSIELNNLMEMPDMRDAALVVLANKQDLDAALNKDELTAALMLTKLTQKYKVLETSANDENALREIMAAMYELLNLEQATK